MTYGTTLSCETLTKDCVIGDDIDTLKKSKNVATDYNRYPIIAGVLVSGIVISLISFFAVSGSMHEKLQQEFASSSNDRVSAFKVSLDNQIEVIGSLTAFYESSQYVSRDEFRNFTSHILERFSDARVFEWAPHVMQNERLSFELDVQKKSDFPTYVITEYSNGIIQRSSERNEYFPVLYMEPYKGNEKALGYDLSSNQVRNEALQRSIRTSKPQATAGIKLVQENSDEMAVLLFSPIFKGQTSADRGNLEGVVLGVYKPQKLLSESLSPLDPAGVDLYLYDVTYGESSQLMAVHQSRTQTTKAMAITRDSLLSLPLHQVYPLEFGGRNWQLIATPAPAFIKGNHLWLPYLVLIVGAVLTGLLTYLLYSAFKQTEMQREMTEVAVASKNALLKSEERFRGIAESMSDWIWEVDADGIYTYCSSNVEIILGYHVDEIIGKSPFDFMVAGEAERVGSIFAKFIRDKKAFRDLENWNNAKDGRKVCLLTSGTPIIDDNGDLLGFRGVDTDITEKKKADELVQKLSQSIEQAGEAIMITDLEGTIEYANPAFERLTGYTVEEVIGKNPRILNSGNQDAEFYAEMWREISSGSVWQNKVIDRKKDGTFYPAMLTISPIRVLSDGKSGITHYVGVQSDLSRLEDLEAQFHQSQKMESLGTLVGGIAHDFNNMLGGITGNLYLAKKAAKEQPDLLNRLNSIEQLSFRSSEMIQQLLTFARKDQVSMNEIPAVPFVKETMKLLRASVPENIDIVTEICNENMIIKGSASQLHQVMMNLVNNACDALGDVDAPCVSVKLDLLQADEPFVEKHNDFTTGEYMHLSVKDNGCGISKRHINNLFEPFFTTKEQGKGTGLGLAMVFGAVKTHHGHIEVDSSEGVGTVIHIYLPLIKPKGVEESIPKQNAAAEGHGELILLVDDNADILETSRDVLESLGYRLLTATNGEQAIEVFKAHSESIDLVIIDVVMPIMSGVDAVQHIRQSKPNIKVIFATGYDKDSSTNMRGEVVLSKPFEIEEMSRIVRQQLDGLEVRAGKV